MHIGDVVTFTDPAGVEHNAIVAGTHPAGDHRISLVYIDEAKAAQVFGTGSWQECIVRVVDVESSVPPPPIPSEDVIAMLENAGPAPSEDETEPKPEQENE